MKTLVMTDDRLFKPHTITDWIQANQCNIRVYFDPFTNPYPDNFPNHGRLWRTVWWMENDATLSIFILQFQGIILGKVEVDLNS